MPPKYCLWNPIVPHNTAYSKATWNALTFIYYKFLVSYINWKKYVWNGDNVIITLIKIITNEAGYDTHKHLIFSHDCHCRHAANELPLTHLLRSHSRGQTPPRLNDNLSPWRRTWAFGRAHYLLPHHALLEKPDPLGKRIVSRIYILYITDALWKSQQTREAWCDDYDQLRYTIANN